MPKSKKISKILVIGSGPIVIGQAAEFDYAGTQACEALREEGYTVILANSNPATIMTDYTVADQVYMEPLTTDFLTKIIRKEQPDALLPTLGGQTALNLAVDLEKRGILEKYDVELLGTSLESIEKAEDREKFRELMKEIQEPVPESSIVSTKEQAVDFAEKIGYPLIVRPAYTLGGTGGGMCYNEEELLAITQAGLSLSPVHQCLIERNIAGYKELEFEVLRDKKNQAIVVCHMENMDPVGIHTGDSIVVAPSQTLTDREYQLLRKVSLKIIRSLGIEGGCNVQLALDPNRFNYYIIEVNPRVSRSSALASKATGYPIAKVAAKIAIGLTLDEIINPLTETTAFYEPTLDYIVTKIPRFPFDKFVSGNRHLGTQMKATGEIMALGRTFSESLLKGIRSLDIGTHTLALTNLENSPDDDLSNRLNRADDERIFVLSEAFRRGWSVKKMYQLTKINPYFLIEIEKIVSMEKKLMNQPFSQHILVKAKQKGFSDEYVASLWETTENQVYQLRQQKHITPVFKRVDSCSAEFESVTSYFYSTYEEENESFMTNKKKIIILGSGPIRIGQGIEFDYATVHSVLAVRKMGYEAIIMNNNPETYSTDFSISDKLYFEPLTVEDVMNVVELEQPEGVIVQFGGQTAINLAKGLEERGVTILGTCLDAIDQAEDRDKFEALLTDLNLLRPKGKAVYELKEVPNVAKKIGYPVLVRPSYVIGGSKMEIVYGEQELQDYLIKSGYESHLEHPILIDEYLTGIEVEIDAISDGETTITPGILEHIERAGVHSGDSIVVYPPQHLHPSIQETCVDMTQKIAKKLQIKGVINIQFIVKGDKVYVLEVNPRASRTIPFLSKVTGIPMAQLATQCILGTSLASLNDQTRRLSEEELVAVKIPVFSFEKLRSVDTTLGPEMKSTGEAIGYDKTLEKALYKGLIASGLELPQEGAVLITVADKDKQEALEIAKWFHLLGFKLFATEGTARSIKEINIPVMKVGKIGSSEPNVLSIIENDEVQFVVNTLTSGRQPRSEGFMIRRTSVERGVACLTSLDTAKAILNVLDATTLLASPIKNKEVVNV